MREMILHGKIIKGIYRIIFWKNKPILTAMTKKVTRNGISGKPTKFNRNKIGTTETMVRLNPGSASPENKDRVFIEIPSTHESIRKSG